jgi:hypothetical protein
MQKVIHRDKIVEYPHFLTKEECDALIAYYEADKDSWQETCFFNTRVMDPFAPARNGKSNVIVNEDFFTSLRARLQQYGEDAMGRELKNLTLSAHKWYPGAYASDHYDNAELDKTANAWQDNKMVTIIYLNDNYEGGNLTFSEHGLSIAPKQGTMIAFDVGIENLHGVSKVITGERYTILASFDWADSVYPEGFLEALKSGKASIAPTQEEQRKEWRRMEEYYHED